MNFAANSSTAPRTQNINDLQLSQTQIYDERERESFKYGVPGNLCMQLSGKGKMMSSSLNNFADGIPMLPMCRIKSSVIFLLWSENTLHLMLSRHTKWTSCCDRIAIRKDLANPPRTPPWPLPRSPLKELRPLLLLPSSSYLLPVSTAEGTSCKGSSFFSKRKTIKHFFWALHKLQLEASRKTSERELSREMSHKHTAASRIVVISN